MRRLVAASTRSLVSADLRRLLEKAFREAKAHGLRDPTGETPAEFIDNDLRELLYRKHDDYGVSFDFCVKMDAQITELAGLLGCPVFESALSRKSVESALRQAGYTVHPPINSSIRASKKVRGASPYRYGGACLCLDILPPERLLYSEGWPINTGRKAHHEFWEVQFGSFRGIGDHNGYCHRFVRNTTELSSVLTRMGAAAEKAVKLNP